MFVTMGLACRFKAPGGGFRNLKLEYDLPHGCSLIWPTQRQLVQIIGRTNFLSDSKVCAGFKGSVFGRE